MCEGRSQSTMRSMNTSVLNYHLSTARTADLEREWQRRRIELDAAAERAERRDSRARGRRLRFAPVARLLG
jgi:hypothetical protein